MEWFSGSNESQHTQQNLITANADINTMELEES
jgi:hypothetical protein